jgi:flagellar hook-basal body complex protein FliE
MDRLSTHSIAFVTVKSGSFRVYLSGEARAASATFAANSRKMFMDTTGIDRMLSQLRTAAALAARKPQTPSTAEAAPAKADFAQVLKSSLNEVARTQNDAAALTKSFTVGDPNTNIQEVMVAMQKANISFQQAVQVRNKLVQAYHEIMNMQV